MFSKLDLSLRQCVIACWIVKYDNMQLQVSMHGKGDGVL